MIKTLPHDWEMDLAELLCSARSELTISTPYISPGGSDFLLRHVTQHFKNDGTLTLITDLSPRNVYQGATDPNSIMSLVRSLKRVNLYHLPRLHAKVYIRDSDEAIVTSGNLTDGGVFRNFEYGISVAVTTSVAVIKNDLLKYAALGGVVSLASLSKYCEISDELKKLYLQQERSVHAQLAKQFRNAIKKADTQLLKSRVAGRSLNATLEKTIIYVLEKHGPLPTTELQKHIQIIHPDLCDDTVLRIINGVRHSAKWKHSVRSAQDSLKRRGLARRRGRVWEMTEHAVEPAYWLKPIGSSDDFIIENQPYDEPTLNIHFARNPTGVRINDRLIVYAVGHKSITSIYRCDSKPMEMSKSAVAKSPRLRRWPYYLVNENLTSAFGRSWTSHNLTYEKLATEFLASNPNAMLTPKGSLFTPSFMRGRDKIRITREFGSFIYEKLLSIC